MNKERQCSKLQEVIEGGIFCFGMGFFVGALLARFSAPLWASIGIGIIVFFQAAAFLDG